VLFILDRESFKETGGLIYCASFNEYGRKILSSAIKERAAKKSVTELLSVVYFESKRIEENWTIDNIQKKIKAKSFDWLKFIKCFQILIEFGLLLVRIVISF